MIILPNKSIIFPSTLGVAGRFKLTATKVESGKSRVLADWFDNLILDQGLNRWGTGAIITACQVGTGNTAPAATQTQLANFLAGTTSIQSQTTSAQSTPPYYGSRIFTFRFNAGAATGNLSEVGVGWSSASGNLFSRALILDGGGSPTTITVLSDEILDVSYEFRTYPPDTDSVFSINISGTDYDCVLRAHSVTSAGHWALVTSAAIGQSVNGNRAYNGALGAITTGPSGTQDASSSQVASAYSNNSFQRDFTTTWNLNDGNLSGGISAIGLCDNNGGNGFGRCGGSYQVSFSPAIPKDASKTLTISHRVQWARKTI